VKPPFKADLKVRLYVCTVLLAAFVEAGLSASAKATADAPKREQREGGQARLPQTRVLGVGRWESQTSAGRSGRLFPPQDLGLLEGPDREAWQKPDEIMDVLGIADGAAVADIGAGAGWFTIRLARRVGPNGVVYAQDVQPQMLAAIRRRVSREGLQNVETRLASDRSPNLPTRALDAVLVVDVYSSVEGVGRVAFLRNLAAALKPGGRIGVVEYRPGRGGPGPAPSEGVRVDSASVEKDARAAGLRIIARQDLPYQYLLVLGH
jgi:SAM-dependent methyltransferase